MRPFRREGKQIPRHCAPRNDNVLELDGHVESLQRLDDCIVKQWADLFNRLVGAIGPGSVRKQGYRKLTLRVEPQRGSGVTEVSEGVDGEMFSGLRGRRGSVPA